MLWSHDLDQPIGSWTDIRETAEGLQVKGQAPLGRRSVRAKSTRCSEKVP